MNYGLIDQTEIDALPEDNAAAFVEFERICRQRLEELLAGLDQNDDWNGPRLRYVATVAAAAAEYEIPGSVDLTEPNPHNFNYEHFTIFDHEITQIVTRLKIKSAKQRHADTFKLPQSRADQIATYVEILRRRIEASDFDDAKKKALKGKLNALEAELRGKRTDLAKTMIILASLATLVNQTEAAVIKLPTTITAIMQVIGMVKQDEATERAAIEAAAKPKAIEDKSSTQSPPPQQSFAAELDDEAPF